MTIERSQSSPSVDQSRRTESDPKTEPKREAPPRESVDRFQQIMQARHEAREEFSGARSKGAGELTGHQRAEAQAAAQQAATREAVDAGRNPTGERHDTLQQARMEPAEVLALMQAQSALRDGAHVATTAPAPANTAAFADLIEKHVRQLAVGGGAATDRDGQVLLRLADATLPGTDLLLSKTADGWLLRADVRSRGSYEAICDAAPDLAKRFAERNLGTLEIDAQLNNA